MDINKIQQQVIQALEQKNADQLSTLSRVLNLIVGKPTMVEVLSTEPMSSADQQKLQQQTAASLSQVREQIRNLTAKIDPKTAALDDRALSQDTRIPPALRALFVRLLDQQTLLASTKLQWADVSQNGKTTSIYTDQTLAAGQKISIQLTNPQRLSFTSLTDSTTGNLSENRLNTPQVTLSSQKLTDTVTNKALVDELLKNFDSSQSNTNQKLQTLSQVINTASLNATKNAALLSGYKDLLPGNNLKSADGQPINNMQNKLAPEAAIELTNKLRELLSLDTQPSQFFSLINRITQQPKPLFDQPETKSIEQILKAIAARIRGPEFFQRSEGIKSSFQQSGIFYESRLNQFARNNLAANTASTFQNTTKDNPNLNTSIATKLQNLIGTDNKGSLLSLIKNSAQSLEQSQAKNDISQSNQSGKTIQADDLQQLIKDLLKPRLGENSFDSISLVKEALTKSTSPNSGASATEQLNKLIEQLQAKDLPKATSDKILNEIVKLIQQEAAHSLTKIQIQQFQSLLQTSDSELGGKYQAQSWQLEVPVRYQHDVHPVHIDIERHWLNPEDDTAKNSETTKTKQWNITLRFDLPLMGEFCAQLTMQGENLSAKLWADRAATHKRIQDELSNLKKQMESDGIVVQSLQCSSGLPAKKQIRLSYSLIDIST